MLDWLRRFNICCFLDNQGYALQPNRHECIAGAGAISVMPIRESSLLPEMDAFISRENDWIFGHLGYGLKDEIMGDCPAGADRVGFQAAFFFVPLYVLNMREGVVEIGSMDEDHDQVFAAISSFGPVVEKPEFDAQLRPRVERREYLDTIAALQQHIHRGDCYEINYCQEFYAERVKLDPWAVFSELMRISPAPFAAFYQIDDSYLLCASPERFLARTGDRLISQPIKGTMPRDLADRAQDEGLKTMLRESPKDRAENVMVVDLVRNDLSRVCREGSVRVDELFGIYTFPQVHQMISTISGQLENEVSFARIVEACFPMGSMTGAPKRKVMELIDCYERVPRGIFSGSVGYITPAKDFDLNVVIRSIMYNAASGYVSYMAGSGITAASDPAAEYEECLVKARALRASLGA